MIPARHTPITHAVARVRAYLAAIDSGTKASVAEAAGVDEKTLRLAKRDDWNPTTKTLQKLEAVIPDSWQPLPRRKGKA